MDLNTTGGRADVPAGTDIATTQDGAPVALNGERVEFHIANSVSVLNDPGSTRAESIGVLRAQILGQHVRHGRRALAMCATQAGVGCTQTAVELAVALAQAGLKTLLIDADMRRPAVDQHIVPSRRLPGLVQYLQDGELTPADVIQMDVVPNLSVLYAGGSMAAPQEGLARSRFHDLVDRCMRDFEITIIDTPPSNASADARRVAFVAGYAAIVAGRNRTFVHDIEVLMEELRTDRTTLIGTVMIDG